MVLAASNVYTYTFNKILPTPRNTNLTNQIRISHILDIFGRSYRNTVDSDRISKVLGVSDIVARVLDDCDRIFRVLGIQVY